MHQCLPKWHSRTSRSKFCTSMPPIPLPCHGLSRQQEPMYILRFEMSWAFHQSGCSSTSETCMSAQSKDNDLSGNKSSCNVKILDAVEFPSAQNAQACQIVVSLRMKTSKSWLFAFHSALHFVKAICPSLGLSLCHCYLPFNLQGHSNRTNHLRCFQMKSKCSDQIRTAMTMQCQTQQLLFQQTSHLALGMTLNSFR